MLSRFKKRFYEILKTSSESSNGRLTLGGLSFAEASFFPVPVEYFLMPILLAARSPRWFWWASFMTITSVLGGIFGYIIGFFLYDLVGAPIVAWYGLEGHFSNVQQIFNENVFWAIFIAGVTPIPYKLATISAGLFAVNFPLFVLASILSRAIKMFVIVYGTRFVGKPVTNFLAKKTDMATAMGLIMIVLTVLFVLY